MCGGFAALAGAGPKRSAQGQALYHLGRLTTYVLLGAIAAYVGAQFDLAAELAGVQRAASIVVGILLIFWGLRALLPGMATVKFPGTAKLDSVLLRCHQMMTGWGRRHGELTFAYFLGFSSTLLPCGWLYTYVAVAATAGSAPAGAWVMAIFWAGTLPILVTIGSLSSLVASPLKVYIPKIIAILMLAAGISSLSGHLGGHDHGMHGHSGMQEHHDMPGHSHHHPSPSPNSPKPTP